MKLYDRLKLSTHLAVEFLIDSPNLALCLWNSFKSFLKGGPICDFHPSNPKVLNVFCHGYVHDKSAFVEFKKRFLEEKLGSILACTLTTTLQDLYRSSEEVRDHIEQTITTHSDFFELPVQVNLIGVSMGGLVALGVTRYFQASPLYEIKKNVTIGTPIKGTELAFLGLGRSAKQMKCHSPYLETLAADLEMLQTVQLFFAATRKDEIIYPWRCCYLWTEGPDHPHQAEFNNTGHFGLLFDPEVISWVVSCIRDSKV